MATVEPYEGLASLSPENGGLEVVVLVELSELGEGRGWHGRAWADHPWLLAHVGLWMTVRTSDGEGRALLTNAEGLLAGAGPPPWR